MKSNQIKSNPDVQPFRKLFDNYIFIFNNTSDISRDSF